MWLLLHCAKSTTENKKMTKQTQNARKGSIVIADLPNVRTDWKGGWVRDYLIGKVSSKISYESKSLTGEREKHYCLTLEHPLYRISQTNKGEYDVLLDMSPDPRAPISVYDSELESLHIGREAILKRLRTVGLKELAQELRTHRDLLDGLEIFCLKSGLKRGEK
jgi:hypothetical protein